MTPTDGAWCSRNRRFAGGRRNGRSGAGWRPTWPKRARISSPPRYVFRLFIFFISFSCLSSFSLFRRSIKSFVRLSSLLFIIFCRQGMSFVCLSFLFISFATKVCLLSVSLLPFIFFAAQVSLLSVSLLFSSSLSILFSLSLSLRFCFRLAFYHSLSRSVFLCLFSIPVCFSLALRRCSTTST